MKEKEFEGFLNKDPARLTAKAVASRMSKARKAEGILRRSLDEVVDSDDLMYESLVTLRKNEDPAHSPMQNALRKYYIFKNDKEFPQLRYYRR